MNKSHTILADPRRLEQASDWLIRLQEDDVPDEEIVRWIDWCEEHEGNRKAFEHLLPLWQAFDDHQGSLRLQAARAHGVAGKRRVGAWAIAASLLIAVMAVLWVSRQRNSVPVLEPVATLASQPAQLQPAILPDGSKLDLGARSAIAIDFTRNSRQIEMQDGEAYFTVKPDKQKPFVVRAGAISVTALGTAFNVQKSDHRVVVTVTEGSVKVAAGQGVGAPEPLLTPAGYQITYDTALSDKPIMRAIDPNAATAWRQGRLEYNTEPLSSIIATLNRYSPHPITLEDPVLARLNYTGTIETQSLEEWIRALPQIFPVQIQITPDERIQITARISPDT